MDVIIKDTQHLKCVFDLFGFLFCGYECQWGGLLCDYEKYSGLSGCTWEDYPSLLLSNPLIKDECEYD